MASEQKQRYAADTKDRTEDAAQEEGGVRRKDKKKKRKKSKSSRLKFYRQLKRIGKGSYGVVDLVRGKDNRLYVMKVVHNTEGKVTASGHLQEARAEAEMLATLKHPNIVEFVEAFVESRYLCLVMSYCRSGDLKGRIRRAKSRNKLFKEQTIMDWFVQMCFGLNYMHRKHFMHRDLKPQNVFLTENNKIVKLGDFGVTRELNSTQALAKTQVGTPYYMSPELAQNEPYSYQSDVWALGCILSETCTLGVPFNADNFRNLVEKITTCQPRKLHTCYSTKLRQLVSSMLCKDPQDRPTTDRVLRNEFVQEHIKSFAARYQDHYGRVQPVTPNVDAYPSKRSSEGGGAKTVEGQARPPASSSSSGVAVTDSIGFDEDEVVQVRRKLKAAESGVAQADPQPRFKTKAPSAVTTTPQSSAQIKALEQTLEEREEKIEDLKEQLRHNDGGRSIPASSNNNQDNDGGRHEMAHTLRQLLADQLRDATALSNFQDKAENREGEELKMVLEDCKEHLKIGEERRQAAEKVEGLLKQSMEARAAGGASTPRRRSLLVQHEMSTPDILRSSPRSSSQPRRRVSISTASTPTTTTTTNTSSSTSSSSQLNNSDGSTGARVRRGSLNARPPASPLVRRAAAAGHNAKNAHMTRGRGKGSSRSNKQPVVITPRARTRAEAEPQPHERGRRAMTPEAAAHLESKLGHKHAAAASAAASSSSGNGHRDHYHRGQRGNGSRSGRHRQEGRKSTHRDKRREAKQKAKTPISAARRKSHRSKEVGNRPGTSDLELSRGSLAATLSEERPSTASSDIIKKSNFLSGVDPTLLKISKFQAQKAVIKQLPTPPSTFSQLAGVGGVPRRRRLPQGGKLKPVLKPIKRPLA